METAGQPNYSDGANIEDLWAAVKGDPANEDLHKRFINFAVMSGQHAMAVALYDEMATEGGEYAELAKRCKGSIAMQVAAKMMVATPVKAVNPTMSRLGWLLVGIGVMLSIFGLVVGTMVGLVGPVAVLIGVLQIIQSRA